MKRGLCLALLCMLCMLASVPRAFAGPADDALKRFVDGVQTLSAQFEQTQVDEDGEVLSKRSGHFDLARPGRFRWRYEQPYEQLMVCDGKQIWNYEPDLAQVTVRPADAVLKGTPASLLAQQRQLGDAFELESGGSQGGVDLVRLKPKGGEAQASDFLSIDLWLQRGVPQRMKFFDALGGSTEVRFSQIKTGVTLDPASFRFTPPKGTEVVGDEGEARP